MIVVVSGASGLVGSALCEQLRGDGHTVRRMVRRPVDKSSDDIYWSVAEKKLEAEKLEGVDAVVHLAGENIAGGRWTTKRKKRISDSRVLGTNLLATVLAARQAKPSVFVCASAIGFYGDRGDEELTEDSPPGDNFLAHTCMNWEAACDSAEQAGIRVANARIGLVLSKSGGALGKMLLPFKLCLGGRLGDGKQYMSWISLDDLVAGLRFLIDHEQMSGPVNLTAPNPVTNAAFTRTLGEVLGRPTPFPAPSFALKMALGQMANELLLASARVVPKRLRDAGFEFRHTQLDDALRAALK